MTPTWRRVATAAAAIVAIGLCIHFIFRSWPTEPALGGPEQIVTLTQFVPGLAFVGAGLIALSVRPANRIGFLIVAMGFVSLFGLEFGFAPNQVGAYLGTLARYLWLAILVHAILAFPTGHLTSRLELILVGAAYSIAGVSGLAFAWLGPTSRVLLVVGFVFLVLLAALAIVLMRRWIMGSAATRRSLTPVAWSVLPLLLSEFIPPIIAAAGRATGYHGERFLIFYLMAPLLAALAPIGLLIGLVRSQLDMSEVAALVVEFKAGQLPELLQPALARVLHDPSVEVLYWVPDVGAYTNLEGDPITLPTDERDRSIVILGDPPLAAIVHSTRANQAKELVDAATAAVQLALENARLQAQLKAQLRELRQSRARIVDAADSERLRVERDLHDGAQQQLVTLLLSLQIAHSQATQRSETATAQSIASNIESLKVALGELRELAHGIHPAILVEAGLGPAVNSLADRCPLAIEVAGDPGRFEPRSEAALYFVAAEAITNAVKHSQGSAVRVDLGRTNGLATIDITDDGMGGADTSSGSGLVGLSDRVSAVGGSFEVVSRQGHGTRVHAEVPCG